MFKFNFTALDERILFDAAGMADIIVQPTTAPPPASMDSSGASSTGTATDTSTAASAEPTHATDVTTDTDHDTANQTASGTEGTIPEGTSLAITPTSPESDIAQGVRVLVVSSQIHDAQTLMDSALQGVKTVYYDSSTTDLQALKTQIQEALGGSKADSIAFASFGVDDGFYLTKNEVVTIDTIQNNTQLQVFWEDVGKMLNTDGRIDLLACNVAGTDKGMQLIATLDHFVDEGSGTVDTSVAASMNLTGHTTDGGDWQLEVGNVDVAHTYFNDARLSDWHQVLDNTAYLVKDIFSGSGSSSPANFTDVNGTLYFTATDSTNGVELWKTDGTAGGTVLVKDIMAGTGSSSAGNLTNVNGVLFFTANNGVNGLELWKSDGTSAGTVMVKDINPSGSSSAANLYNANGTLFFSAVDPPHGTEVWISDGTVTGTHVAKFIASGQGSADPSGFIYLNNFVYFSAASGGDRELYKSNMDGSSVVRVKDINTTGSSNPENLTVLGNKIIFKATTAANGSELWITDGTSSGTVMVKDINPLVNGSSISNFVVMGNYAYFSANNGTNGAELWRTDGTAAGTQIVKDINTGLASSNPANFTVMNGVLYFSAASSGSNMELWRSDGTAAGTFLVKDIETGSTGSSPSYFAVVDNTLYFAATTSSSGTELWKSDGTAAGTVMVKDISAGSSSSSPYSLTASGNALYFGATDSSTGTEIWALKPNAIPQAGADSYSLNEDNTLSVNAANGLLANDVDTSGSGILTVSSYTTPAHGTLNYVNADGSFSYTPAANYNGTDSFTYTISNGWGGTTTATVTLTIGAVNDSPLNTVPSTQTTNEDTSLIFSAANGNMIAVSDVDAGASNIQVTLTAANGTMTLNGTAGLTFTAGTGTNNATMVFTGTMANINAALNGLTFTPNVNYSGTASIQISTNDMGNTGSGGSLTDTDTVNIAVNAVNDAPVNIVPLTAQGTNEDTSLVFSSANGNQISISDVDASNSTMQVTLTAANGTMTLSNTSGLSFITGNGVNNGTMVFQGTISSINTALNGLSFTPNANFSGNASIQIVTNDMGNTGTGGALTDTDTVNITVNAVNDAPVNIVPASVSVNEDTNLIFSSANGNQIAISDVDAAGNVMRVTLTSTNGVMSLSQTTGLTFTTGTGANNSLMVFQGTINDINAALNGLNFTPNANYAGAAAIQIITNDLGNTGSGGALSDTDTINITVNAVNDAPVNIVPAAGTTINEDTSLVFSSANGNQIAISDIDANNNPVKVTLTSSNGTMVLAQTTGLTFSTQQVNSMTFTGTISNINAALNGLTFTPDANFSGTASIQIATNDLGNTGAGGPLTDTDTIDITVNPVNDAPFNTVPSAPVATNEDVSLIFSPANGNMIAINDVDAGNNVVQVTLTATNGTMSLSGTTGLSFTTGAGVNNATMVFRGTISDINAALNGLSFNPNPDYYGSASIQIVTNDLGNTGSGGALIDSDSVVITVNSVNDAPINQIAASSVSTYEDTNLVFSAANNNAISVSDVDVGSSGTMEITLMANNGSLTLSQTTGLTFSNGDGSADTLMVFRGTIANINAALNGLIFSPNANFNGAANIQLTSNDLGNSGSGNQLTDTDVININVNAVNDAPLNHVPASDTGFQNSDIIFSSGNNNLISISDIDANNQVVQITLAGDHGKVSLSGTAGLTFITGTGTNDSVVTVQGTVSDINNALNGLKFTPANNYYGNASIQVTTNDLGNTGIGGSLTDTDTINLFVYQTIADFNTVPSNVSTAEDIAIVFSSSVDRQIVITDPDVGNEAIQLTLTATNGVMTLGSTAGISFISGDGINDALIVMQGTVADLNSALEGLSFTPDANFNGNAAIQIVTDDLAKGSGGGNNLVDTDIIQIAVSAVNDAPLNHAPAAVSTAEDTSIVFSSATGNPISISDLDAGNATVQVSLTASHGLLSLGSANNLTFVSGTGTNDAMVIIQGTISNINNALQGLTFIPDANFTGNAAIQIVTDDLGNVGSGGPLIDTDTINITVDPVNDAPLNNVPVNVVTAEDTALVFSSSNNNLISISDIDAGNAVVQVSLTAANGVISLSGAAGLTFLSGNGVNDSTLTVQGTISDINAALNGLSFTPDANFNGNASILITTDDLGNVGSGGHLTDTDTIHISVFAMNDAPLNNLPATAATAEDTTLVFSSQNNNLISISDIDAGNQFVQVSLIAVNGTMSLNTLAGLTFVVGNGVNDTSMVFEGTISDINAALNGLSFTPDANFNGSATIQVSTDDLGNTGSGGQLTDTDTINITVSPVNDAPLNNVPAAVNTAEDTDIVFSSANSQLISISDIDAGNEVVQVSLAATNGTMTLSGTAGLNFLAGDGTNDASIVMQGTISNINAALNGLTFSPDANFNGLAAIQIATDDLGNVGTGGNLTDIDTIVINVTPVNDAPLNLAPASATTAEDMPLVFSSISINDIDAGNAPVQVSLTASNGLLSLSGTNGLTFITGDGFNDGSIVMQGTISDINAALNGLAFTPDVNFNGPASIQIATDDLGNVGSGGHLTDTDTINITVTAVNDAPLNAVPSAITIDEDSSVTFSATNNNLIVINDIDAGNAEVQVSLTASNGTLTLSGISGLTFLAGTGANDAAIVIKGAISDINAALNGMTFTPDANFYGDASIQIETNDLGNIGSGGNLVDTDTIEIAVNPVNDAPWNNVPATADTAEDTSLIFTSISVNDLDAGNNVVQVTLTAENGIITLSKVSGLTFLTGDGIGNSEMVFRGTISDINDALFGLSFTPDANFTGVAGIHMLTDDLGNVGSGGNLTDTDTIRIDVSPVNDAPLNNVPISANTAEDTSLVFSSISISDLDAGNGVVQVTLTAEHGSMTLSGNTGLTFIIGDGSNNSEMVFRGTISDINAALNGLSFNPEANYNGHASIQITTNDLGNVGSGGDLSDTDTISINVSPVNDAPLNNAPASAATAEDTELVFSTISISDIDAGNEVVQVSLTASNGAMTLSGTAGLTFLTGDGSNNGAMVFQGTINDINAALNGLKFTPDANYNGPATIQIVTDDLGNVGSGGRLTDTDIIHIEVNPVNDAPLNNVPATAATAEDTSLVFNSISISDIDAGNETVQVSLTAANGTMTLSAITGLNFLSGNGTNNTEMVFQGTISDINAALNGLAFTPDANFNGSASIQIVTDDLGNVGSGGHLTDTDTINITVSAVNDAPLNNVPFTAAAAEDTPLVFTSISISDIDAGNEIVQVTLVAENGGMTLSGTLGLTFLTGDGTNDTSMVMQGKISDINAALNGLTFTPDANYNGPAKIQIVTDDLGNVGSGGPLSDTDTINITVSPVNDAPLNNVPASASTAEDTSLVFTSISISDIDAGNETVQVALTAANGVMTLSGTNGLTFLSGNGTNDTAIVVQGTISDINAALNGLTFTPNANYNGPASIQIATDDLGNVGSGGHLTDTDTINIDVSPVNDAPLNNVPATAATAEDTSLVFNSISISDIDAGNEIVQVTLTAANGLLTLSGTTGLNLFVGDGTNDATMVIQGTISDINAALNGLTFTPDANYNGPATIQIITDDLGHIGAGGPLTDTDIIDITISPVNDAPLNNVPVSADTAEDTSLVFHSISISDIDANNSVVQISLTATYGTMTLSGLNGLTFLSGDGTNNAAMVIQGTISDINAALNGLTFTPDANYNGPAAIQITTDDLGNIGSGGNLSDTDTISINISPVNDAPLNNFPATASTAEDTPLVFSSISISDLDAGNAIVQVSLSATNGAISLSGINGLTFLAGTGTNNAAMVFQGTISDINAALNGMTFTPDADYNGPAAVQIITDDLGNVGSGGNLTDTDTIQIDISPVNDAPLNNVPSTAATAEDTPLVFTSISISDLDASNELVQVSLTSTNGVMTLSGTAGLTFMTGSGTFDSVIVIRGTISDINAALNGLTFTPDGNYNGPAAIQIATDDLGNIGSGGNLTDVDTIQIDISPVNDAPLNNVPATAATAEDTPLAFTTISISDIDAGNGVVQVSLTASNGAMTLSGTSGLSFLDGNGTDNRFMVFQGTVSDINAALNGLIFTPDANFNGPASIEVATDDLGNVGSGGFLTDRDTVHITVTPVNDAPLNNVPASAATAEDTTLIFSDISISDIDAANQVVEVSLNATNGVVSLSGTNGLAFSQGDGFNDPILVFRGTIADINAALNGLAFTPDANYNGPAAIQMTTNDLGNIGFGGALTASDLINIDVSPVNDAPLNTVPANASTAEDTSLVFSTISINDIDSANAVVQVSLAATNGAITLSGTTGLTFISGDGVNNSIMVFQGTISDINAALNGLAFTPDANYNGPASIEIATNDLGNVGTGGNLTDTDTINITVAAVNDAPLNNIPATAATAEDTALAFSSISINDIDAGNAIVQVGLTVTNGLLSLNGTSGLTFITGDGVNNSSIVIQGTISDINSALSGLTFTPDANYTGQAVLQIITDDLGNVGSGGNLTDTDTIDITVTAVNDAPFNTAPSTATIAEDTSLVFSAANNNAIFITDIDASNQDIQVSLTAANGVMTLNGTAGLMFIKGTGANDSLLVIQGTISDINNALDGLTFTPDANFNGSAGIQLVTDDLGNVGSGGRLTDTGTIDITVSPVNDAPLNTVPATAADAEDTDLAFSTISINDIDGSNSVVEVTLSAANGSLTLSGINGLTFTTGNGLNNPVMVFQGTIDDINAALNGLTFSPDANYNGPATIQITTNDLGNIGAGGFLSDTDTISITVSPVNDAPLNNAPASAATAEDTALVFSSISIADIDAGNSVIQLSLTAANGAMTLSGTAGLTFLAGDGLNNASMVVQGTISDINAALNGLTFTPEANYNGPASIKIVTEDLGNIGSGGNLSDTDTILIDVSPVNDAPLNNLPVAASTAEDTALVFSSANNNLISVNDIDAGNAVVQITLTASNGTLSLSGTDGLTFATGTGANNSLMVFQGTISDINAALNGLSFTPDANYNGPASIQIETNDLGNVGSGGNLTDTDTITISVSAVNDAPLNNVPASAATAEDTSLVFSSISISDIDAGNEIVQVSLTAVNGVLTLSGVDGLTFIDGAGTGNATMTFQGTISDINAALNGLTFTPDANYNGPATIQIVTNDLGNVGSGGTLTDTDTIAIDITPVNDAPLNHVPDSVVTPEDMPYLFSSISISDLDASNSIVQVTLTAANGTLTLSGTAGLTLISGTGTNDAGLVIRGAIADINTALNGMTFTPVADFNGNASIQIVTDDLGNVGSGGRLTDTDTIAVTVSPVNDAPFNTVPANAATAEDTDLVFNTIAINDIDASNSVVEVSLTAANGSMTLSGISGVTFTTGSGLKDQAMVFRGTIADINSALNGLTYTPDANFTGPASIQITTNDLGNTGAGGFLVDTDTILIDVTAVNDAPLNNVPISADTAEDTALAFSTISINDIDAGNAVVQITLTATNGAMTLSGITGLTFITGDGTDNSEMVIQGTISDINAALNGLKFTPSENYNGPASIQIITDDLGNVGSGGNLTDTDTIYINITPVNDAPLNNAPASAATAEDTSLVFSSGNNQLISISDIDAGNGYVQVSLLAANGVMSLSGTAGLDFITGSGLNESSMIFRGTISDINAALNGLTFTPAPDFNGSASIQIATDDLGNVGSGGNLSDTDVIDISVTPVNDAPFNNAPISAATAEDTSLVFSSANNRLIAISDIDAGNGIMQVSLTAGNGLISLSGTAGLTFTDGSGTNDSSMVFRGTISDINNALNGLTFTPDANYNGPAGIRIVTDDLGNLGSGGNLTDTNIINISVSPVNDAPLNNAPSSVATAEDVSLVFSSANNQLISISDIDAGNEVVQVSLMSSNGVISLNGTSGLTFLTGDGTNNTAMVFLGTISDINTALNGLTFTPNANFYGDAGILMVTDDLGNIGSGDRLTAASSIDISVNPINDAPLNNVPSSVITAEDTRVIFSSATSPISITDIDAGNGVVQVSLTATNGLMTLGAASGLTFITGDGLNNSQIVIQGTVSDINNALNGMYFSPDADFNGTASIQIVTDDLGNMGAGGHLTDSDTININVAAVNDAPFNTVPASASTAEDTPLVFSSANNQLISIQDIDAGNQIIQVVLNATNGTVSLSSAVGLTFINGSGINDGILVIQGTVSDINSALDGLIFTPDENYNGPAALQIITDDLGNVGSGGRLTDTDTINITVNAVNDAPFHTLPSAVSTAEDTSLIFSAGLNRLIQVHDIDASNPVVEVSLEASNGLITLNGTGGLTFELGNGTNNALMVFEGTISDINAALDGLVFTPNPDYYGPASIRITTDDLGNVGSGGDLASTDTIAISVAPVNDAPFNTVPSSASTAEDTSLVFSDAANRLISVNDIDGNNEIVQVSITGVNGTVSLNGTNGLTLIAGSGSSDSLVTFQGAISDINAALNGLVFTPDADFNGQASILIVTDDLGNIGSGNALTDTDIIPIAVTPVNDAPLNIIPSNAATAEDTSLVFSSIQINDIDAGNEVVEVTLNSANGSLTLSGFTGLTFIEGSGTESNHMVVQGTIADINTALNGLLFKPDANFNGQASIQIITDDLGNIGSGGALSDSDTIAITVSPVNDAPLNNVPANAGVYVDSDIIFSDAANQQISISDLDAGNQTIQVSLIADKGTLTLHQIAGLTIVSGGNGSGTIVIQGTISAINDALNGLIFHPTEAGSGSIKVETDDLGNIGAGDQLSDVDVIPIQIHSLVTQPEVDLPDDSSLPMNGNLIFSFAGNNDIAILNTDYGDREIQVTLNAIHGTLTLGSVQGLTFLLGDGTDNINMIFKGTQRDINQALDGLTFRALPNYAGQAGLNVSVTNFGDVYSIDPEKTTSHTINLNIIGASTPIQVLPPTTTVPQDYPVIFSLLRGNPIQLGDTAIDTIKVELNANYGLISLLNESNIQVLEGTGTNDARLVIQGSKDSINTVLERLIFIPDENYIGEAGIHIKAMDAENADESTTIGNVKINIKPRQITVQNPAQDTSTGYGVEELSGLLPFREKGVETLVIASTIMSPGNALDNLVQGQILQTTHRVLPPDALLKQNTTATTHIEGEPLSGEQMEKSIPYTVGAMVLKTETNMIHDEDIALNPDDKSIYTDMIKNALKKMDKEI